MINKSKKVYFENNIKYNVSYKVIVDIYVYFEVLRWI